MWSNGERVYQQAAAYTLMFNTGLRTGEVLDLRAERYFGEDTARLGGITEGLEL